jgi:hypothetical protein
VPILYTKRWLAPHQILKLGGLTLSYFHDFILHIQNYQPCLEAFSIHIWKMCPTVVRRNSFSMQNYSFFKKFAFIIEPEDPSPSSQKPSFDLCLEPF